jgi:hypothetical protein
MQFPNTTTIGVEDVGIWKEISPEAYTACSRSQK